MEVITIKADINQSIEKVWEYWNDPKHIVNWSMASDSWHVPFAKNDLEVGGKFISRMEAKDGSMGFDFGGTYDEIIKNKFIAYTLGDGRKVKIEFIRDREMTKVVESFEAEESNPIKMQKDGWQAILDNFKKYIEKN
ncbi:SRPBCC family protein [Clostridium hydrogenum]|uniref:SRPBCC family protein n=1 Tax=Clostridium hydrogenum TaxID=2855764 RepID=UPI002E3093B1|nr:SRPBCC domain-containing protein [Clostridium hydrogenum]